MVVDQGIRMMMRYEFPREGGSTYVFLRVKKRMTLCSFLDRWGKRGRTPGTAVRSAEQHAEEGRQEEEEDCGASRTVLDLDAPTWLI